jgi:hypothetical protein
VSARLERDHEAERSALPGVTGPLDRVLSSLRSRLGWRSEYDEPMAQSSDLTTWEDFHEYFELVRWLIPDIYRHSKSRVAIVVLLSLVGVLARAAAIGSMILYVKARTTGDPLVFANITLPTEASLQVFLLWGSTALVFAAITIVASYRADTITFDLAQGYMEMAVRRVLRHQAEGRPFDLPQDIHPQNSIPVDAMLRGDTLRLVRVVLQTLGILLPLITLIAAVAVLLVINWILTLFLIPAVICYSYGLGLINRGVVRNTQKRRSSQRQQGRDVGAILRTTYNTRYPADTQPEWLDSYPRKTWLRETMSASRSVILARKRVGYLSDAFQGIALLVIVMAFGSFVADQGTTWAVLLTYLMALAFATRNMGNVSKCVTAANRFIPHVRRYVSFMRANPVSEPLAPSRGRSGAYNVAAQVPRLPESRDMVAIQPGQIVWCVSDAPLRNPGLGDLCLALAGGDPEEALQLEKETFFLRGIEPLPERMLRSYFSFENRDQREIRTQVEAFLDSLGVREEYEAQLGGLDATLTAEIDSQLSPLLRYGLRLLPGYLAQPNLFILDLGTLERFGDAGHERVLAALANRVVILVSRGTQPPSTEEIAAVMVVVGGVVSGIGNLEWYSGLERPDSADESNPTEVEGGDSRSFDDPMDFEDED